VPDTSVERKRHVPPASDLYRIAHILPEEERQVRDMGRPMTFVMVKSGAISLLISATYSYTLGVEAVLQETFPFKGGLV
jgi:hypothetical protein